jgi:hypothetical protein
MVYLNEQYFVLEILANKTHQWFTLMNDTLYWRFLRIRRTNGLP